MNILFKKVLWWVFGALCVLVGMYPAVYLAREGTFGLLLSKSEELLADGLWNAGFYIHILFGGIALVVGWMQFSKKLRVERLQLHRWIGKLYVISVTASGLCAVYIGFFATGGLASGLGFISLGLFWLLTTLLAFGAARKGAIEQHQMYMVFSYAACFAAVTLRIWLPLLIAVTGDFLLSYRIVAWLCWVPNVLVAWLIIRKKGEKQTSLEVEGADQSQ